MKALLYEGKKTLRLAQCPSPVVADDEALISIAAAGICGSDMHAFLGHDERRPPPLILGHEAAGKLADGKNVVINPLVVCEQCDYCNIGRSNLCLRRQIISMPPRQGSFADMLAMPQKNILPLPSNLSMQQGALAEPLACGHHAAALAVCHLEKIPANTAAILGGGAIGLAAALSLAGRGVKNIYIAEPNLLRHPLLKKAGDFHVITPDSMPTSVDIVIEAVGVEATRRQASAIVAAGGVVVHIGLGGGNDGFDMRRLTLQEITLCGSYTYTMEEFVETVQWMEEGKLGTLDWFETRPLAEGAAAFDDLLAGKVAAPKIILLP
ncbi:MAG: zinc-dependent alcohol dehydrogenase [Gammaproteobacteria bacterium WSBS_2016_MAG_OTU1]